MDLDQVRQRSDAWLPRWAVRAREIAMAVWEEFREDDVLGTAAELSFRWLLAVFPLAIMTAAFTGFASGALSIDDPTEQLLDAIGSAMPPEAAATLKPQLERVLQGRDGGLFSLGLALTIYAASAGFRALFKALNRAYDIKETRPLWRQYAVAIGLTLLVGTVAVAAFLVLTAGGLALEALAQASDIGDVVTTSIGPIVTLLTLVALIGAMAVLYRLTPARSPSWRGVLPGVALFVPAWLIATFGFSLYVENFGSYADMYGALAGVIVLLLWFYISSIILLVGGELNAVVERRAREGDEAAGITSDARDDA